MVNKFSHKLGIHRGATSKLVESPYFIAHNSQAQVSHVKKLSKFYFVFVWSLNEHIQEYHLDSGHVIDPALFLSKWVETASHKSRDGVIPFKLL